MSQKHQFFFCEQFDFLSSTFDIEIIYNFSQELT